MEPVERRVWLLVTLAGGVGLAIFGTGLFALVEGSLRFGVALTLIGMIVVAEVWRRANQTEPRQSPLQGQYAVALALILLLTWGFLGYDIYLKIGSQGAREHAGTPPPAEGRAESVGQATPTVYRNQLSPAGVFGLMWQLALALQDQKVSFYLSAPASAQEFKFDVFGIFRTACLMDVTNETVHSVDAHPTKAVCGISELPNITRDLDGPVVPSGLPGIVVHGEDNNIVEVLTNILGRYFIVHKTRDVPESVKRLGNADWPLLVWLEVGAGSPWKQ